jgi:hypothetical protein
VQGITNGIGWVVQAAQNLGGAVIGAIKAKLGIASPSKVFEQVGMFSGMGFADGITGAMDRYVSPAVSDMHAMTANDNAAAGGPAARGPAMAGPAGLAAPSAGGGKAVSINLTVNVNGSGDPKATAEAVQKIILSRLTGAIEELAIEAA